MTVTTMAVTCDVDVDERAWARVYGAGDAYNEAEAQRSRSLVADVEDYVADALAASGAAREGAIGDVAVTVERDE